MQKGSSGFAPIQMESVQLDLNFNTEIEIILWNVKTHWKSQGRNVETLKRTWNHTFWRKCFISIIFLDKTERWKCCNNNFIFQERHIIFMIARALYKISNIWSSKHNNINSCATLLKKLFQCVGREPWSSGYERRPMSWRLWVRIPAPFTGKTFFHINLL